MSKTSPQLQDLSDSLAASAAQLPLAPGSYGATTNSSSFVDVTWANPKITCPNTTVVNRAYIPNIANDLKSSFGVERIMTQQMYQIFQESGPSGQPVYGILNDVNNLIRLVGAWSNLVDGNGARPASSTQTDYAEITFYGTGLNLLTSLYQANFTMTYYLDGSTSPVTFFTTTGNSTVLEGRNYNENQIIPIVSGLSLGVHTLRIVYTTGLINCSGFEILNTNSTTLLNTNSGIAYINGAKAYASTAQTVAYNAQSVGTTGGRVINYLTSNGVLAQAYTQCATSSTLLPTTHTNEEVVRVYNYREFAAGRSDDFSAVPLSSYITAAFTLDDGTTTLVGYGVAIAASVNSLGLDNNGSYITLTFVGTGVDIVELDSANGGNDSYTFQIDGGTAQAWPYTAGSTSSRVVKLASGLPYGTHTLTLNRVSAGTWALGVMNFIVYQPKTPSLPSGSILISDYNVMANTNFATLTGNTNTNYLAVAVGTLWKASAREFVYTGSWSINGPAYPFALAAKSAVTVTTAAAGAAISYTFFGTGAAFEILQDNVSTSSVTIAIDGTNNATGTAVNGVNNGSGNYTINTNSSDPAAWIYFSGLTLGLHTIKLTYNSGANVNLCGLHIATPIHSYKSNLYADLQNTLAVGSNSIGDDRLLSSQVNLTTANKAWAQAIGVTSSPTSTTTNFVPCPDLSVTIKTNGGPLKCSYSVELFSSGTYQVDTQVFVDGVAVGTQKNQNPAGGGYGVINSDSVVVPVAAGSHKVDVYWTTSAGTMTAVNTNRNLLVEEK